MMYAQNTLAISYVIEYLIENSKAICVFMHQIQVFHVRN